MMQKQILTTHNLTVGIHDDLIAGIRLGVFSRDRIGIIGSNGSGKTLLLKTLSGEHEPLGGTYQLQGSVYYVAQVHGVAGWAGMTVLDYVQSCGLDFAVVDRFIQEKFGRSYDSNRKMSLLSGGQQALVVLACGFLKKPSLLLLDEPTNHLDQATKQILVKLIQDFPGAIICVSHDVWFLKEITQSLWIIQNGAIRAFTGSYTQYQDELLKNEESRDRKREVVQKEKKKLEHARDQEQVRAARSKREGKKQQADRSLARGEVGAKKMKAERVAGRNKKQLDDREEIISEKLEQLTNKKKKKVSGSIVTSDVRGSLLHIHEAALSVAGHRLIDKIDLDMQKGDRIVISGNNGTGKSALVKALLGKPGYVLDPMPYKNSAFRFEYLDQQYSIIDPEKSVLENAVSFSGEQTERVRQHLTHFLFGDSLEVLKKAKNLSGGMLARLAFVMLTMAPIDLLILDEPTNNLDIETIEQIQELLQEYRGGLIVISHDRNFVQELGIQRFYSIKDDGLVIDQEMV